MFSSIKSQIDRVSYLFLGKTAWIVDKQKNVWQSNYY